MEFTIVQALLSSSGFQPRQTICYYLAFQVKFLPIFTDIHFEEFLVGGSNMEVKATQPTEWSNTPSTVKTAADFATETSKSVLQENSEKTNLSDTQQGEKPEPTEKELLPITRELNRFFQYLNADLRFEFHEGANRLMVKIVDTKTDKILREFPPHELLDKIANIREYVGVLLDKKA